MSQTPLFTCLCCCDVIFPKKFVKTFFLGTTSEVNGCVFIYLKIAMNLNIAKKKTVKVTVIATSQRMLLILRMTYPPLRKSSGQQQYCTRESLGDLTSDVQSAEASEAQSQKFNGYI